MVWGVVKADTSGFLEYSRSKSRAGAKWQRRFFSLETQYLKYYKDEDRSTMKGAVDMSFLHTCRFSADGTILLLELLVSGQAVRR